MCQQRRDGLGRRRKLSKEKATGRIDLMVAAVMAVGCAQGQAAENIDDFLNSPIYA